MEENVDGEKNIEINLKDGEIWAKVVEDDFAEGKNSSFAIYANNSKNNSLGGIFDISSGEEETIRSLSGELEIEIFGEGFP